MSKKNPHLPALPADRLKLVLQALQRSRISKPGQRAVARSLQAAANPDAESPDVVIASLPAARRATVEATVKQMQDFSAGITRRGGKALRAMSDAEFQALVEAANASE